MAIVGLVYRQGCGPAQLGNDCIVRAHTIIYGDVSIGEGAMVAAGVHVFVEKPLASIISSGREMIEAGHAHRVVLGVGHIERFNLAIIALKKRLVNNQLGRIIQIHARRIGPFPRTSKTWAWC